MEGNPLHGGVVSVNGLVSTPIGPVIITAMPSDAFLSRTNRTVLRLTLMASPKPVTSEERNLRSGA